MCVAVRFSQKEFTIEQLKSTGLEVIEGEVRVSFLQNKPLLPVVYRGQNLLLPWGNKGDSRLPKTGFCKLSSLNSGRWQWLSPVPILVIASSALTNGVWYQVQRGIKAILVKDEKGKPRVYILTTEATHYFRTMTGADRMPVLEGQVI